MEETLIGRLSAVYLDDNFEGALDIFAPESRVPPDMTGLSQARQRIFQWAVAKNHRDLAVLLLSSGEVDVNQTLADVLEDAWGQTNDRDLPPHPKLGQFITDKVRPENFPPGAQFALLWTCTFNQVDLMYALLEENFAYPERPTFLDADGGMAFITACRKGFSEIVRLFVEVEFGNGRFGIDPSIDENKAVKIACDYNRVQVLRVLLAQEKVDPTVDRCYTMRMAAKWGLHDIVRILYEERKVDPAVSRNEPFRSAAERNHVGVLRVLLEECDGLVNPLDMDNYAIQAASINGHHEVVRVILEETKAGEDEESNRACVLGACRGGFTEVIRVFMDLRIRVDANSDEYLKAAVAAGKVEAVMFLVDEMGVDPQADENDPIISASRLGHLEVVRYLLTCANPTARNYEAFRVAYGQEVFALLLGHKQVDQVEARLANTKYYV